MITLSKVGELAIPHNGEMCPVLKIESGGAVIWQHGSLLPISLEVEKVAGSTTVDGVTYKDERKILLNIRSFAGGSPVRVTYGGLTKEVDFSTSEFQDVFFGSHKGVSDEVETPESGTLIIEGNVRTIVTKSGCRCVTGINNWGAMEFVQQSAFSGCSSLNVSYIPEGITLIAPYAFQSCEAITRMRIASTVTEIGGDAFKGCINLTTVTMDATTPPSVVRSPFTNCPGLVEIIVPAGCGDAYRTASGWSEYASMIVEAS